MPKLLNLSRYSFIRHRSNPKRLKREDCLDNTAPLAMALIRESIIRHTQPSPCQSVTDHDFTPGNHSRSCADNSLVCNYPERCITESVRYIIGTRLDLFRACLHDLAMAVRLALHNKLPSVLPLSF